MSLTLHALSLFKVFFSVHKNTPRLYTFKQERWINWINVVPWTNIFVINMYRNGEPLCLSLYTTANGVVSLREKSSVHWIDYIKSSNHMLISDFLCGIQFTNLIPFKPFVTLPMSYIVVERSRNPVEKVFKAFRKSCFMNVHRRGLHSAVRKRKKIMLVTIMFIAFGDMV